MLQILLSSLLIITTITCQSKFETTTATVQQPQKVEAKVEEIPPPKPCQKETTHYKFDSGSSIQVDDLGKINTQKDSYQVLFVTRLAQLITNKRASLFLILEGKKETFAYEVDQLLGVECCISEGELWIGTRNCAVDLEEVGDEWMCPDCSELSCVFMLSEGYNPLEDLKR